MKNQKIFQGLILIALVLFAISVILIALGNITTTGPLLIGFFILLGIGFRGFPKFKGYTYTTMIFAGVTAAMFYPQPLTEYQGYSFSRLITPLIQIIMFGMGTSMSLKDFAGVVKMPQAVLLGLGSQLTIMPLIGFVIASFSGLPPEIAAGIILIGCSPSGLASNVMSYLAKANLALSITITAICTLIAPFSTPFLMSLLAGTFISIDVWEMMWSIIKMVIFPIGGGLLFNRFLAGRAKWLDDAMPLVSMIGIGIIITIITAAGRDSLIEIGGLLIVLVLIHNVMGYNLGYWAGRLFKLDERDCRTIALEVGMQNGGLASGLANEMGKAATVGLAPAVFGPLMNITGSVLASYWHRKPPLEKPSKKSQVIKVEK